MNVICYDIVNKLIEIDLGDKIILEFDREENSLFNLDDYKNFDYIVNIIKRCVQNNRVNILDYVLYNLDTSIKTLNIEPVIIYLLNLPKNNKRINKEYVYIDLLKIILKYGYNLNVFIREDKNTEQLSLIEYCIENDYEMSAKLLIENKIKIEPIYLIKCVDKQNHIILDSLIRKNHNVLKILFSEQTLLTYIIENLENNNIDNRNTMRFLTKIIKTIIQKEDDGITNLLNYQDTKNELFGFRILKSKLKDNEKIIIFTLLKDLINPIEVSSHIKNNVNIQNYPLVIFSMILNQVEITYLLLNNMFKNKLIKKINSNNTNTIFDYYHTEKKINFNFIPMVFKYVQDNYSNSNFDENLIINKKILLEYDEKCIEIFLLLCGYIMYFYLDKIYNLNNLNCQKNNSLTSDQKINSKSNKNILSKEPNAYMEITVESGINNLIDTDTFIEENKTNKTNKTNKQIWMSSNIKISDESLSESEIQFN